jgi:hypothetical protein
MGKLATILTRIEYRNDVGMLKPSGELDLPEKAVGAQGRGQFRSEDL